MPGVASAPAIAEVFRKFRLVNFIFLPLVGFFRVPAGLVLPRVFTNIGNHYFGSHYYWQPLRHSVKLYQEYFILDVQFLPTGYPALKSSLLSRQSV
jgi:hypothetical protein